MNNKAVKHPIVTSGAGTACPSGTPEFSPVIVKHPIVTSGVGTAYPSATPEFSPVIVNIRLLLVEQELHTLPEHPSSARL